jgi:hypothetical protein
MTGVLPICPVKCVTDVIGLYLDTNPPMQGERVSCKACAPWSVGLLIETISVSTGKGLRRFCF